jgi:hypothetical protein
MSDRWGRLAPLTGVLFGALVIAALIMGGETPKANASAAKVLVYFHNHRSKVELSAILVVIAFLVFLFFAGSLRSHLRKAEGAEGLSALSLAGASVLVIGVFTVASIEYGLAHHLYSLSAAEAQTLNFLSNELFVVVLAGLFVFALSSGLAILRSGALSAWLGWLAIVMAILMVIVPIAFAGLFLAIVWAIAVGIAIYRKGEDRDEVQPGPSAPEPRSEPAV